MSSLLVSQENWLISHNWSGHRPTKPTTWAPSARDDQVSHHAQVQKKFDGRSVGLTDINYKVPGSIPNVVSNN